MVHGPSAGPSSAVAWLHSVQNRVYLGAGETRAQKHQGDANANHHYDNCCLVDALRALGHKLPYTQAGPFRIRDGNLWLEPFGQPICN